MVLASAKRKPTITLKIQKKEGCAGDVTKLLGIITYLNYEAEIENQGQRREKLRKEHGAYD